MCRLLSGSPSWATRSQRIFPVRLSIAYIIQRWRERSSEASPSPYRPGRKVAFGRLLIALVTKMRSPQTIGLECARPGIGVRQRMFSPVLTFQVSGSPCCSAMPDACGPRNDGQLPAPSPAFARSGVRSATVRSIRRAGHRPGLARRPPRAAIEDHPARPAAVGHEIERQAAAVISKPIPSRPVTAVGTVRTSNSISPPSAFQLPLNAGQPSPSSVNVPPGTKRAVNAPKES